MRGWLPVRKAVGVARHGHGLRKTRHVIEPVNTPLFYFFPHKIQHPFRIKINKYRS